MLSRSAIRALVSNWPILAVIGSCLSVGALPANGQSTAPADAGWQFAVAPYVWAAGIKGNLATLPPAPPIAADASFAEIIENLDVAFMLLAEARHDRFVALLDITYTRLSLKADTPGPLFGDAEMVSTAMFATLTGGYRVISEPAGFVEPFAGARLWHLDTDVKLKSGLLQGRKGSESETWVDPVLGIRGRANLGSGIFVSGYADIGGFGLGSDFSWQVYGGAGYEFSSSTSAFAGYRYLSVDYSRNGFVYDIVQQGPMVGMAFRF